MVTILLESALFVALLATGGALVAFGVFGRPGLTRLGAWWREGANRKRIERLAADRALLHCPAHGDHAAGDLVRLPDGRRLCPACYAEAFDLNPRDTAPRDGHP